MNKSGLTQDIIHNIPEYSVKEIADKIRGLLEDTFDYIRVRGEISELHKARSGHLYITLQDRKEEGKTLRVVCWRSRVQNLAINPERGQDVTITGKITAYSGSSQYQLDMQTIELSGVGLLLQRYEELKKKLFALGVFAPERKLKLPTFPKCVGVITSLQGAVIHDILNRVALRFPCCVTVWNVKVQGDGCAKQVIEAIKGFNSIKKNRPDVIIIARGGGSFQDLWEFNNEEMIMSVAESTIPIVSAIGHETDNPLLDYVADVRSPTPTAAAEYTLPLRSELISELNNKQNRMRDANRRLIENCHQSIKQISRRVKFVETYLKQSQQTLDNIANRLIQTSIHITKSKFTYLKSLRLISPRQVWKFQQKRLEEISQILRTRIKNIIAKSLSSHIQISKSITSIVYGSLLRKKQNMKYLNKQLLSLSHESQLSRGYAMIFDEGNAIVKSNKNVQEGQILNIIMSKGQRIITKVVGKSKNIKL